MEEAENSPYAGQMTSTQDNRWFETAINTLNDPKHQRVWSLIVSIFGDLAQAQGDQLSSGALNRIMTPMGIKNDAIRVALHRLRKDGWIDSARSGRNSVHYLTEFGRRQSAEVTPRIYDRDRIRFTDWHILIANDQADQSCLDRLCETAGYVSLGRFTAMGHGAIPDPACDLLSLAVTPSIRRTWNKISSNRSSVSLPISTITSQRPFVE